MVNADKSNVKGREEDIPGLYVPQQGRSHRAMSRVLTHFHRLLKQKAFGDIQMSAISKASGVGVGTIYFRFSSKEYLLIALAEKIVREDIEPSYQELFLPGNIQKKTLEEFLFAYFKVASIVFSNYGYLIKPLTLISRETSDEKIPEFVKTLNTNIHQKLSKNIMALARLSNPSVTETSVEFAILWAGASLREAFLYEEPISDLIHGQDELFILELSKALTRYLEFK